MTGLRRVVFVGVAAVVAAATGLLIGVESASAQATTVTYHAIESGGGAGLTCSGETFLVSGTSNFVLHQTTDAAGGVHFDEHASTQHFGGVALPSGTRYEAPSTYETTSNARPDGTGGYELTTVLRYRLIGQGPDNNDTFERTVHLTVNANGEVTANSDSTITFNCH